MPHPHRPASATGLPPVPVAVLLPPPASRPTGHHPAGEMADWHGVAPRDAAGLIARCTKPGDLVIELDAHPTITRAARHLGRRPATPSAHGDGRDHAAPEPSTSAQLTERIGLIFAALPRPGLHPLDLDATSAAMQTWRTWLRAGGYLIAALTPPGPHPGRRHRPVSHRAVVIAAARTAGLMWKQEFLVLTVPPPEHEPRAMPDTAAATPSALVDGRHRPVHIKVLAFRHAGGHDA